MANDRYPEHEILVGPVRARPEIWRILATLAAAFVAFYGLDSLLNGVLSAVLRDRWWTWLRDDGLTGSTAPGLLILLYWFGVMGVALALGVRLVQARGPQTLLGPASLFVPQFVRVFLYCAGVTAVIGILPPYDFGDPLVPNMELGRWIAFLPLAIPAVLVQVGTEEVIFRGFLQQSLAARFNRPWVWMAVPSALFALGHYAPDEMGDSAVLYVLWSFTFGVLMADLTARAGTLGPAIAVHFVNNLVAILFISLPDSLNGLALYLTPYDLSEGVDAQGWLLVDLAGIIVMWLAARLALRR
ncbi:CPBP family intramembrane glutamic endopeptidase [Chachezhania sediminis]|uniref:CPBP family intramembrane glutamic endopeptidase n=1 Tax=Chachezhania sediminis TaxID=2599291 RepID=UPI00131C82C7|nr:type II CAAX endopeptidase family protein [Chachezhania sediminis]